MILSITGHRSGPKMGGYNLPNPVYIKVCKEIDKVLRELKPDKVISGMCIGTDQWFVNIALKLKIPVVAAIPFEGQEKKWPEYSRIVYHKLLSKVDEIVYVCPPGYSAQKMQERNKWLVNQCDILLGVFDGSSGGTANCIEYAKSINKQIIIINPASI